MFYNVKSVSLKSISINKFVFFRREFRERRKQNALKNAYNQNNNHRVKKSRRARTAQAFYPCPPPTAAELEHYDDSDSDDEFIDYNAVSY